MTKLLKLKKRQNRGAIGQLYADAKKTQDERLIKEVNKIIIFNQNKKKKIN